MSSRQTPQIASRKQPSQSRSAVLVKAVLDAAVQVLAEEGAQRFTTARVAERAGVSVGSLYQYFPNKAAILFRLQSDEWGQTAAAMRDILEDTGRSPAKRLRALVHAFVRSECEEARMRIALKDAAPLYRDAPEADEARASCDGVITNFMREALPSAADEARALAGDLVMATLSEVGRRFSEVPRSAADIATYADAMADMLCAYLGDLAAARRSPGRSALTKR